MRPEWLKLTSWPRKFAHSCFSSLVHSLPPKDNLFNNIFQWHILNTFLQKSNIKDDQFVGMTN